MSRAETRYTFGDGSPASARLRELAAVFEPSSRAWLGIAREHLDRDVARACDLGCGPGHTTRLVHQVLGGETCGLDSSARFVEEARASYPALSFEVHDVTRAPFPGPRADVLYARFLLTHLTEPARVVRTWAEQAAPGGVVVLEELHEMTSAHPALQRYYAIVAAMQAALGQSMRIGVELPGIAQRAGVEIVLDEVARLALPGDRMARLHHQNLATWRHDPYAQANHTADEIDALDHDIAAIIEDGRGVVVDYRMRQMVLRAR